MPETPENESRTAAIQHLLALLPARQRAEVAAALEGTDSYSQQVLAAVLTTAQSARRRKAILLILAGTGLLSLLLLAHAAPLISALGGVAGLVVLLRATHCDRPTPLEEALLEAAVQDETPRSISVLLKGAQLLTLPRHQRDSVKQALTLRLHRLTPEDERLMPAVHCEEICRILHLSPLRNDLELRLACLAALQNVGDQSCLGALYRLAAQASDADGALIIQRTAGECLEKLGARLDFGAVWRLRQYIQTCLHQFGTEDFDAQEYATSMLALRRLLPQLNPNDPRRVLSLQDRDSLYQMLALLQTGQTKLFYGADLLMNEIVRTAQRLRDTRALPAIHKIVHSRRLLSGWHGLLRLAEETYPLLEAQAALEKEGQTLLRGSTAPAAAGELLRAAGRTVAPSDPAELLHVSNTGAVGAERDPYRQSPGG